MSFKRNIIILSLGTATSRVLGFARDVLIAGILGAGPVADAFVVAFRLPNLFRRLFAEGAFSSAFVPLFARELALNGEAGARKFANESWAFLCTTLLIFTLLAEIFAPQFVMLLAPGFVSDPAKFALTVQLARICFPYLLCMSLLALLAGMLNAKGHYKAAAFAPTALNIIISLAAGIAWYFDYIPQKAGFALVYSVLIAGFIQLGILLWAAKRAGFVPTQFFPKYTANIRKLLRFGAPSVLSAGVTQINIVVGTLIASSTAGAVSYLYYADRVYQLPLGIVATAIGTALLPPISALIAKNEVEGANTLQNQGIFFTLMLTLPATIALLIMPNEICNVLFARGAFTAQDALETGRAVAAYAIGLPAFVLIKVLSPAFFARENSKTPFYFAAISMIINVIASFALAPTMQATGIALASSIAGWANVFLLGATLLYNKHWQPSVTLMRQSFVCILASCAMGAALYYSLEHAQPFFTATNTSLVKFSALAVVVFSGMVIYFSLAFILNGVSPKSMLASFIKSRKK